MDEEFPLSLPIGATVVSLPWVDQDSEMGQGVGDQGWLVEAPTPGTATTTWRFGKVRVAPNNVVRERLELLR